MMTNPMIGKELQGCIMTTPPNRIWMSSQATTPRYAFELEIFITFFDSPTKEGQQVLVLYEAGPSKYNFLNGWFLAVWLVGHRAPRCSWVTAHCLVTTMDLFIHPHLHPDSLFHHVVPDARLKKGRPHQHTHSYTTLSNALRTLLAVTWLCQLA